MRDIKYNFIERLALWFAFGHAVAAIVVGAS